MSSDASTLDSALAELTTSTEGSDHATNGFHHRHTAAPQQISAIARAFCDSGYWLEMLTAEDRRFDDIGKLRLVYCFNNPEVADRHVVFAEVDLGQEVDSLVAVYAAADWFEREVSEMYGILFAGHPNLKRLLLPEDTSFHALLKDFGNPADAEEGGAQ